MEYGKVKISNERSIVIQDSRIKDSIDIRTYLETANYTGFTQKGIVIPKGKVKELVEILSKIE